MAIISPAQLPIVLRVDSNPLKFHVLSQLGHPVVLVELAEPQMEQVLRSTGDFMARYFPLEERYAFFNTIPLQAEYPIPEDAYWIRSVVWDPATTRIDEIFGAESFLFCLDESFKILDKDSQLQYLGDWEDSWKASTPYGNKRLSIIRRELTKDIPKTKVTYETGEIIATINHPIFVNDSKWREFSELRVGDELHGVKNRVRVQNLEACGSNQAISVRALGAGAYYGCHEGEPILIH